MDQETEAAVKKLMDYSLKPIAYDYEWLTESEKKLVTKEEFEKVVKWSKGEVK